MMKQFGKNNLLCVSRKEKFLYNLISRWLLLHRIVKAWELLTSLNESHGGLTLVAKFS